MNRTPDRPERPVSTANVTDLAVALPIAVDETVGKFVGPVSLLFSGGLDSSLLAKILSLRERPLELVTVGMEGAPDLQAAKEAASHLGLPWDGHVVSADSVREAAERVRRLAPHLSVNDVAIQAGLDLAIRMAHHTLVLCGQGADELFLGYAHFHPLHGARLSDRARADMQRLRTQDWPLSCRLAKEAQRDLRTPYLAEAFCARVEAIPLEERREHGRPKALLRDVALKLGLPEPLASRPKKALQYGSGIYRALAPR